MLRRLSIAPLLFAAALLASCREKAAAPAAPSRPPVFLISIDTLRSDRLPAYGYREGRTPAIDAFRADSVLFSHAYANVPSTLPSHASIFTGRLPHGHGVRDNIGYALRADETTLASILRANGYATGAAVSSFVLRRETGIAGGFEFFDDATPIATGETISSWQREGESTRRALGGWLDSVGGRSVFGFLHLYEPHVPYTPPEPLRSQIADPYDGEIAQADAVVGRFLDDLRRRGLYHDALIVLLSDHGEGLGDHGELEHGVFLYREAIQVPLLVKLPRQERAGETIERPVSLTDVLPSVLARLEIEPPRALDGVDLFAPATADRAIFSESWYPRVHYGWSELTSQIGARFHFIRAPAVELYDTRADPRETRNLANEERRVVAAMRRELDAIAARHPFEPPAAADPETVRKLESLGYLGGGAAAASGALPDPKAKIALLAEFGRAAGHLQRGEHQKAIAIARAIVDENPDFLQGWGLLSSAYREAGDLERAAAALTAQMKRAPGNPQTALALSSIQLEMRRFDEARAHASLALSWSPSLAQEAIARVELARGDLEAAERAALAASAAAPLRVQPPMIRSQIRRARQDPAGELGLLDEVRRRIAAGEASPVPELEFRRGEALLQLRRVGEAEAAFRAETERFPENRRAWGNLALVVDAQGRREEARALLDRAMAANPGSAMRGIAREILSVTGDREGLRRLETESAR